MSTNFLATRGQYNDLKHNVHKMSTYEPFVVNVKVKNTFFQRGRNTFFQAFQFLISVSSGKVMFLWLFERIDKTNYIVDSKHEAAKLVHKAEESHDPWFILNYNPADIKGAVCSNQQHLVWICLSDIHHKVLTMFQYKYSKNEATEEDLNQQQTPFGVSLFKSKWAPITPPPLIYSYM